MEEARYNWREIIVSALLIFIIPLAANVGLSTAAAIVVGFQTRGDQEAIMQQVSAFTASALFLIPMLLLTGGIVFWRGRTMVKKDLLMPLPNAMIAAALGKLIHSIVILSQSTDLGFTLPWLAADWVVSLLAAYVSVAMANRVDTR